MITMWNVAIAPSARAIRIDLDLGSGLLLHLDERRITRRALDAARSVPLTGAVLPDTVTEVLVEGEIAGRLIEERFDPAPDLAYVVDPALIGPVAACPTAAGLRVGWRFARRGVLPSRTRWWDRSVLLEEWDARSAGLHGFTPTQYHRLDPVTATMWTGSGRRIATTGTVIGAARRAHGLGRLAAGDDDILVVSGSVVHVFDGVGLHQRTVDLVRGRALATFRHDDEGRLGGWELLGPKARYEVRHQETSTIITTPGSQWAAISEDAGGRAALIEMAEGAPIGIGYGDDGLIANSTGPRRQRVELTHNDDGALVSWRHNSGRRVDLVFSGTDRERRTSLITGTGREFTSIEERGRLGATRHTRRCCGAAAPTLTVDSAVGTTIHHPDGSIERRVTWSSNGPFPGRTMERTTLRTPKGRTRVTTVSRTSFATGLDVITTVDGRTTRRRFDSTSGLVSETTPAGRVHTTTLVPNRHMRVRRAGLAEVVTEFDSGLPGRISHGDHAVTFEHDEHGRLATVIDGTDRREIHHDAAGRVVAIEVARGWVRFDHDEAGDITAITTPSGATTRFNRTPDGRVESTVGPETDGGTTRVHYRYDDDRQLASKAVEGGATITYRRDAVGRLTVVGADRLQIDIEVDDASGRVRSVATADGDVVAWTRDGPLTIRETATGRVKGTVEQRHVGQLLADAVIVDQTVLPIERDADGAIATIGPVRIARDPVTGFVQSIATGSLVTRRTHNEFGALIGQRTEAGSRLLFEEVITRDDRGRVTEVSETDADGTHTKAYRYADDGLIAADRDGVTELTLDRDPNGNIVVYQRADEITRAEVDAADRLTSFDGRPTRSGPAGELLDSGERRHQFDALGRVTTIATEGKPSIGHSHDGLGRLIESTADGGPYLQILWSGAHPAAVSGADRVRRICITGGEQIAPEALLEGERVLRLVTDHRGSVRLVVDAVTGEVLQQLDYDALGRRVVDSHPGFQPFGFNGCLHDAYTGLVHMGQRVLDPRSSRFLTPDPLGFDGGQTNLYTFAGNDPINRRDPNGNQSSPSGGVQVCTAPFIGSNSTPSIDHVFLKTENWSRGQAINPDAPWYEKATLQTEWADETTHPAGKDKPGMSDDDKPTCRPVENVDEKCLDKFTQPGNPLGTYGIEVFGIPAEPNVCYDAVFNALDACAGPGGWDYGETEFGNVDGPRTLANVYEGIRSLPNIPAMVWDWLTSD